MRPDWTGRLVSREVRMRPIWLAVLLCLLLAARCFAQPRVECDVTRHDYGVRLPGPLPPSDFLIVNRGTDPLTLKPQLCCGMQLTGAEAPIPAGAARHLVVTPTHPLGDGGMNKSVRLQTNDPERPELVLELLAMGKSPLQVLPADELSVPLQDEFIPPQIVTLRVNYEPSLKLTSIRCSAPYVQCREVEPEVPEGEKREQYRAVEITVSATAPSTPYEAVIAIGTSCRARPEVKLRVFGLSPTAVTPQPPRVDYDPLEPGAALATRVVILSRSMGPFKILGTAASDPRMQVKVVADPSGMFAEVVAKFVPGPHRGPFHGTITIRTDDPERPRVVIPYTGEAR
jgi:hypothetical protein